MAIKSKRIQILTDTQVPDLEAQVNSFLEENPEWEVSPMHVSPGLGEQDDLFFITLIMTVYHHED